MVIYTALAELAKASHPTPDFRNSRSNDSHKLPFLRVHLIKANKIVEASSKRTSAIRNPGSLPLLPKKGIKLRKVFCPEGSLFVKRSSPFCF